MSSDAEEPAQQPGPHAGSGDTASRPGDEAGNSNGWADEDGTYGGGSIEDLIAEDDHDHAEYDYEQEEDQHNQGDAGQPAGGDAQLLAAASGKEQDQAEEQANGGVGKSVPAAYYEGLGDAGPSGEAAPWDRQHLQQQQQQQQMGGAGPPFRGQGGFRGHANSRGMHMFPDTARGSGQQGRYGRQHGTIPHFPGRQGPGAGTGGMGGMAMQGHMPGMVPDMMAMMMPSIFGDAGNMMMQQMGLAPAPPQQQQRLAGAKYRPAGVTVPEGLQAGSAAPAVAAGSGAATAGGVAGPHAVALPLVSPRSSNVWVRPQPPPSQQQQAAEAAAFANGTASAGEPVVRVRLPGRQAGATGTAPLHSPGVGTDRRPSVGAASVGAGPGSEADLAELLARPTAMGTRVVEWSGADQAAGALELQPSWEYPAEDLPGDDFVPVMGGPPTIMPDLGRGAGRGFRPGPRPLAPGGRGAALVRPLGRGQNKWVRPGAAGAADAADVGEAAGKDRPTKAKEPQQKLQIVERAHPEQDASGKPAAAAGAAEAAASERVSSGGLPEVVAGKEQGAASNEEGAAAGAQKEVGGGAASQDVQGAPSAAAAAPTAAATDAVPASAKLQGAAATGAGGTAPAADAAAVLALKRQMEELKRKIAMKERLIKQHKGPTQGAEQAVAPGPGEADTTVGQQPAKRPRLVEAAASAQAKPTVRAPTAAPATAAEGPAAAAIPAAAAAAGRAGAGRHVSPHPRPPAAGLGAGRGRGPGRGPGPRLGSGPGPRVVGPGQRQGQPLTVQVRLPSGPHHDQLGQGMALAQQGSWPGAAEYTGEDEDAGLEGMGGMGMSMDLEAHHEPPPAVAAGVWGADVGNGGGYVPEGLPTSLQEPVQDEVLRSSAAMEEPIERWEPSGRWGEDEVAGEEVGTLRAGLQDRVVEGRRGREAEPSARRSEDGGAKRREAGGEQWRERLVSDSREWERGGDRGGEGRRRISRSRSRSKSRSRRPSDVSGAGRRDSDRGQGKDRGREKGWDGDKSSGGDRAKGRDRGQGQSRDRGRSRSVSRGSSESSSRSRSRDRGRRKSKKGKERDRSRSRSRGRGSKKSKKSSKSRRD